MELLRLKRMLSKYSYYQDEFNETDFLFKEYSNAFNKEFGIIPIPAPVPTGPIPGSEPEFELESEPEPEPVSLQKSDLVSKLYRKLSLVTHPDKRGGSAEIFNQVSTEYSKGNTLGLLLLAHSHHIEVLEYLEYYSECDFENDLKVLSDESSNIKSKLAWVWQSADSVKRMELQKRFGF